MSSLKTTPHVIRVEGSTLCQLRCPTCPTTEGVVHANLGAGFLKATDFERLLDQQGSPGTVFELSNYGEVFLNPQIVDILRIAREREVWVSAYSGANLNTLKDEVLEAIVKYQMLGITCSIDGASDETYEKYRKRGNFTRVLNNVKRIVDLKRETGAILPYLNWQFVVFGHNEHEIESARSMATDLGMDFILKTSWDEDISPAHREENLCEHPFQDVISSPDTDGKQQPFYAENLCEQLWHRPQLNYDGRVLGCCVNVWGDFGGNAFEDFQGAMNTEKIVYARKMLQGATPPRSDIPCVNCSVYAARLERQEWVVIPE